MKGDAMTLKKLLLPVTTMILAIALIMTGVYAYRIKRDYDVLTLSLLDENRDQGQLIIDGVNYGNHLTRHDSAQFWIPLD